jgi:hypothetical protein
MQRLGQTTIEDRGASKDRGARRFSGPYVSQRHRQCRHCGRPFLSGLLLIERGFTTGGVCDTCLERAKAGEIDAEELLPSQD